MSWLGWISKKVQGAKAQAAPRPAQSLPVARPRPLVAQSVTTEVFQQAMRQARLGNRKALLALYERVGEDAHLTSVVQQRMLATLSRPYVLAGPDGKPAVAATAALAGGWLVDFMRLALRSVFYGPGLIQLGPPQPEGGFSSATAVPEQLLWPMSGEVETEGGKRIRYTEPPYADWAVPVGPPDEPGLLARAVPLLAAKQSAIAGWNRYLELCGVPFRIARTEVQDQTQFQRLQNTLEQMGTSGWGILDMDESLEFLSTHAGTTGQHGYEQLCRFADEQVSKLVLGQTMTTDRGGSLAQAQVHERTAQALFRADALWLEELINTDLLPRMARLGMPVGGALFHFLPDENALPPETKLELVKALLPHYRIPASWLQAEFGIEAKEF